MAELISAYPPGIWLILLATGLMIGVLAGLLGVGGGVIAVPVLLEIFEAIGVDAARYALTRSSVDTPIDIDLQLWSSASSENPVYYVQYAHARLSALARNAADLGLAADTAHLELLTHDKEGTLIRSLGEFSRVLQAAATLREPHRVCRYLEDLAGDYHRFYDSCRVLPQGDEAFGAMTSFLRARFPMLAAARPAAEGR